MNKEIAKMNQRAFEFARENETTMTTAEVAQQLGTKPNVITENAKKCLPNKRIENGKTTFWTQEEITILLDFIKSHKVGAGVNLSNDLIGVSTDLTPALKIKKAMELVTTKELAEMLGITPRSIQITVEELTKNNSQVFREIQRNSQGGYLFNEAQATAIKIELQNHTKIAKNGFDTLTISNDLEMIAIQQRLNEYQSRRIKELQAENEAQKQRLAIAEPKAKWYDDFADCTGLIEIGVVGKHLEPYGLGAVKIFDRLKADGIIYEKTTDGVKSYFAYFRYRQYFAYRNGKYEKPDGKKIAYSKLMCTKVGAQWLESKYSV